MATRPRPPAWPATTFWLYLLIVLILGATLIVGVVCWIWLTFEDKRMPDGLATVLATIAGGLVGALTMGELGRSRMQRPRAGGGEPRGGDTDEA
jgi:hypothetical protein